jgi:uncharacterized membrane protein YhhN
MQVHLGIAAVLVALGHWAGFLPTANEMVPAGLAVFVVCHLLFGLWVRSQVQPLAGDRPVLPDLVLGSVAMLLALLPRLIWPAAERVQLAAAIAGLVLIGLMVVKGIRRWRQLPRRHT